MRTKKYPTHPDEVKLYYEGGILRSGVATHPRLTKHPYQFRIHAMQNYHGIQIATTGARITQFCKKHKIDFKQFAGLANNIAEDYGCQVTVPDILNYVNRDVSPKTDKMYAIYLALSQEYPNEYKALLQYLCGWNDAQFRIPPGQKVKVPAGQTAKAS